MNLVPTKADRIAHLSLKLLAAINVLVFLSFVTVALLASSRARAEAVTCNGADMVAGLQKSDPAAYAAIEKEAAAVPNGKGLLWRLEKAGEKPSWLFGTMHMTDPRVVTLPAAAQKAFDGAGTVIIETTDVLDQGKMMAALAKEPELMMFTDGKTLDAFLSPDDVKALDKGLDARGIPPASVAKMKPWMLSAMVSLPACEMARKSEGKPVLDVNLAERSEERRVGKECRSRWSPYH